ncbi:MAG TPA: PAS domain S-box protein [Candidatus Sulfotelmatobacter sp.]|jgi:PAS domain S-box-containing protein|nr:PAS domain S-box protein [Candidatus Sulfotelmatobacter sp.]
MNDLVQIIKESISSRDGTLSLQRLKIQLSALGLLLALAVGLGGWLYYRHEYAIASQAAQETLVSIADLKVKAIENWMNERLGDTEVMRDSMMARSVLLNPASPDARQLAAKRFDVWLKVYDYAAVMVADSNGVVQLGEPSNYPLPARDVTEHVQRALQPSSSVQADLRRDAGGKVYLWFSGQVFTRLQTNGPPDGVFISMVDPYRFLYPFLEKWPTPSKSAETLLVARDGDNVVFLTPLRHATNEPLTLHFPITASQLPSAKMFRGDNDMAEGQTVESADYRGVRVLAVTRWIPNTPWLMVSKVDKEELFAPLRLEAYEIEIISALFLLVIILGIGLLWRQQKLIYARTGELRLRTLIEQAPLAININRDEKLVYANKKFLDYYGYQTVEELLGRSIFIFWAQEFREIVKERMRKRAQGEPVSSDYEGMAQRKDGSRFPIQIDVASVELPDGPASLVFINDITGRKRDEQSLRETKEQIQYILDNTKDVIFQIDLQGNYIYGNAAAEQLTGYPLAELLKLNMMQVVAPEYHALVNERLQRRLSGGPDEKEFEFELLHKQGRLVWTELTTSKVCDSGGRLIAIQGVARDITERKRAQDELIWKTALLEAQVDSTLDGILVVDTTGRKVLQNRQFIEMFQVPEEVVRDSDDANLLRYAINQMKKPGQFTERVTYLYAHPDEVGSDEIELADGRVFDRYSAPVRDKMGKLFGRIWSFRDITQRRKLEEQFRQSQKMEAVGQLASGVAHDFNNILAVIQLQSELLKSDGGLSESQRDYAAEIGASAQRAAALTRQLLLFSRKEKMQPRNLDLNNCINDLTKMLRRTLGEHVQLQFRFAMQSLIVRADPGMMDQVLMNLAVNARDAMPRGGDLIIKTAVVELDDLASAQLPFSRPGSFVCLSVSDTGCGIAPEIMPKIFEPFFTTKEVGKGTGLGLATVFGIVNQHQGWIRVRSEVGRGTTFEVYLPLVPGVADGKETLASRKPLAGGNETILLVEDEFTLRTSLRTTLTQLGYRVLEAGTGVEAGKLWEQHRAEIALLLTDLVMPGGLTGKELAENLSQTGPELRVIYISGYNPDAADKNFVLEEGVNFLTKPFATDKLAQTIRNKLDQSS